MRSSHLILMLALLLAAAALGDAGAEKRAEFIRPPLVLSPQDSIWLKIRVPRHTDNRRLRVEACTLEAVAWSATFPFAGGIEQAPADDVRWEVRDCGIRASEEPLEGASARVQFSVIWLPLAEGHYELHAKVTTWNGLSYTARTRLMVGAP